MFKKTFRLKKKGFTLLEMLVVIGIIGVIVSMGFVSYSTSQKKARDAKRKSDISSIQNGLEQYYSVCGYKYPTPNAVSNSVFTTISCPTPPVTIMPTVPVDPRTTTPYPCNSCNATSYQLCTTLEAEATTNYCVTNQQ